MRRMENIVCTWGSKHAKAQSSEYFAIAVALLQIPNSEKLTTDSVRLHNVSKTIRTKDIYSVGQTK